MQHLLTVMVYAGCQAVSVTLAVVKEATCPRFHADHVRLRGLLTYW